jgi:RNA polymerase sigma factor (TIGR02999 family)
VGATLTLAGERNILTADVATVTRDLERGLHRWACEFHEVTLALRMSKELIESISRLIDSIDGNQPAVDYSECHDLSFSIIAIIVLCYHSSVTPITSILGRAELGSQEAAELFTAVYDELRLLAARKMAKEQPGQTLQPTALVHEAWLRLGGDAQPSWENRAHFFAAAAEAMRRILVERARRRSAEKRGGGRVHVSLDEIEVPCSGDNDEQLLWLNESLEKLCKTNPRKGELVKLRYFVGLSFEESASVLGIAVPTAKEWWAYARAWLAVEIKKVAGS